MELGKPAGALLAEKLELYLPLEFITVALEDAYPERILVKHVLPKSEKSVVIISIVGDKLSIEIQEKVTPEEVHTVLNAVKSSTDKIHFLRIKEE